MSPQSHGLPAAVVRVVSRRHGTAAHCCGINLNFFPAGPIFRRGGAFFIRRSFKGNKLYSTIFREYLAELFAKGYAVEYFSEGGRSRTGRLLQAKTACWR